MLNARQIGTAPQMAVSKFESVIGDGLSVTGELSSDGNIRIEGYVVGRDAVISEKGTVLVGKTGKVHSNIKADTVIIAGKVVGDLFASTVSLQKTATLNGDIYCTSSNVEIARGATVEGSIRMNVSQSDDNLSPEAYIKSLADTGIIPKDTPEKMAAGELLYSDYIKQLVANNVTPKETAEKLLNEKL